MSVNNPDIKAAMDAGGCGNRQNCF